MATESYLVTGGCGLQGSSIVEQLRMRYPNAPVAVLSRNPTINTFHGVTYHRGDITVVNDIASALSISKATVVFHCAATMTVGRARVCDVTVRAVHEGGTRNMLEQSVRFGVKAFIFTSSASVVQKDLKGINGGDESWPLASYDDAIPLMYPKAKAAAERLVLAADNTGEYGRKTRTVSLRPALIYGERDSDITVTVVQHGRAGLNKIQIGNETNMWFSSTYVENSTEAHLLAMEKLLSPDAAVRDSVGGEAFCINNEEKISFYDFQRMMWKYAGIGNGPGDTEGVRIISKGLALWMAWAVEWWSWLRGTGPPKFSTVAILLVTIPRWYHIDKAKTLLGYKQKVPWEEGCRRAVEWYMENEKKNAADKSK